MQAGMDLNQKSGGGIYLNVYLHHTNINIFLLKYHLIIESIIFRYLLLNHKWDNMMCEYKINLNKKMY